MKTVQIFIVLVFLPSYLFCQSYLNKPGYRVISLSGLNIRELPSTQSAIIGGIPFLEEVQILNESDDWIRDTIGSNIFYNPHENDDYDIPVSGSWIRVKYAETDGFVFSPYLADIELIQKNRIEKTNTKYGLSFPGQLCFDNIHRNKELKWFGLYKAQITEGYFLEPIEISYNITDTEYTWLNVLGGEKGLLLMFGVSDSSMIDKDVSGLFSYLFTENANFIDYNINTPLYEGDDLIFNYENGRWVLSLIINGKTQILNPKNYNLSSPESLIWKGDIDGDNKNDYILKYGDKSTQVVLYLSSEAEAEELVRPVAVFYTGYCC